MQWKGVLPAITTSFDTGLNVDHSFLAEHCRWLLEKGCTVLLHSAPSEKAQLSRVMKSPRSCEPASKLRREGRRWSRRSRRSPQLRPLILPATLERSVVTGSWSCRPTSIAAIGVR